MLEIYNETVVDLLAEKPSKKGLEVSAFLHGRQWRCYGERERQTERQRDRDRDRDRETETDRQADRQTDRQRTMWSDQNEGKIIAAKEGGGGA